MSDVLGLLVVIVACLAGASVLEAMQKRRDEQARAAMLERMDAAIDKCLRHLRTAPPLVDQSQSVDGQAEPNSVDHLRHWRVPPSE